MKTETIEAITEDSVLKQIRRLESSGFYLHDVWYRPQKKHKGPQGRRRAKDMPPHMLEVKRAYWRRGKATLRAKYTHLKTTIGKRHPEYEGVFMSFDEWSLLWRKAGTITLGDGSQRLAWQARGRDRTGGWGATPDRPQLRRWDLAKPYTIDNIYVVHQDKVLADGERIAEFLQENPE